jgi:hypothetical protein
MSAAGFRQADLKRFDLLASRNDGQFRLLRARAERPRRRAAE